MIMKKNKLSNNNFLKNKLIKYLSNVLTIINFLKLKIYKLKNKLLLVKL